MNILTFDIEDWWVYDTYSDEDPKKYYSRLNKYLDEILENLNDTNTKATFFCLGKVAEKYPEVIKKIVNENHHIGCHSYSHEFITNLTPEDFLEDTRKAIDFIEQISGVKVDSYRAPSFSLTQSNIWAFEILYECGIRYDSSIFPASRRFGGFPGFESEVPCIISINGVELKEFPLPMARFLAKKINYSGGGYFRLLPYRLIKTLMSNSYYNMTYFHLYNFDKEQKRHFKSFNGESAIIRYFKNYYGLNSAYSKFERLTSDFSFMSLMQADKFITWDKKVILK